MTILVSGSSGHLGEGLMRLLKMQGRDVKGLDLIPGQHTDFVGSLADPDFVEACMNSIDVVLHTATLHKPHVATHAKAEFVSTNIHGTLNLLEAAVNHGVRAFIFTSTTSTFGDALSPPRDQPAAWITEAVMPIPKNIYGVTKVAAEDMCYLFHRKHGLNTIILRTSRFFPEEDDNRMMRQNYADKNAKANEFLFRRADLEDIAEAHLLAAEKAEMIGFGKYIISATSPFRENDLSGLRHHPEKIVEQYFPTFCDIYKAVGYKMFPSIDRVYVNDLARSHLGWKPKYTFEVILNQVDQGRSIGSDLAREIGQKGYHSAEFTDGPYPVE